MLTFTVLFSASQLLGVSFFICSEFSTFPQDQAFLNRKRLQSAQIKLKSTTAQVEEYEKSTSDLRQQLSDVRAENAQLHIQLNVTKFQLVKAEAAIETIHHSFEQREQTHKSLQDELSKVQSERTSFEVQLAELTSANIEYAKESREQRAEIQRQQQQISNLNSQLISEYLRHRYLRL